MKSSFGTLLKIVSSDTFAMQKQQPETTKNLIPCFLASIFSIDTNYSNQKNHKCQHIEIRNWHVGYLVITSGLDGDQNSYQKANKLIPNA